MGLLVYLVPKTKAWLLNNTDAAAQRRIQLLVQSFARAAAQRKQFVQDQLRVLGVEATEAVINCAFSL